MSTSAAWSLLLWDDEMKMICSARTSQKYLSIYYDLCVKILTCKVTTADNCSKVQYSPSEMSWDRSSIKKRLRTSNLFNTLVNILSYFPPLETVTNTRAAWYLAATGICLRSKNSCLTFISRGHLTRNTHDHHISVFTLIWRYFKILHTEHTISSEVKAQSSDQIIDVFVGTIRLRSL